MVAHHPAGTDGGGEGIVAHRPAGTDGGGEGIVAGPPDAGAGLGDCGVGAWSPGPVHRVSRISHAGAGQGSLDSVTQGITLRGSNLPSVC